MNKAITDGLVLMPPPFSAGLNLWSREDGTPGSGSYAGQPNAAFVPADQDFAGCMELQKTSSVQKVRSFAQTPMQPGLYLRVTARVKAVSGNLPSVRIAAWAGSVSGTNVAAAPQTGPSTTLSTYGTVVTVTAIIGPGNRQGVDMVWGTTPVYAHIGLDLTGPNNGVVRIDDIVVEDVTEIFHRDLMDWVDVRDYGAIGNGVADDTAAFVAADAAAGAQGILVPAGTYRLTAHTTLNASVRFTGTVSMAAGLRLFCLRNFNIDTYTAAFGNEEEGLRRGLAALFYLPDHVSFDMLGRRIVIDAPIDVSAISGLTTLVQRRVLGHGQIVAGNSAAWDDTVVTSVATFTPASSGITLTAVANVANVPIGARVTGTGVGREVYVLDKNIGAGTVTLSVPLWGSAGTRTYTFTRYKYLLDFSGFENLGRFEIFDTELQCEGRASAIMLPRSGTAFRFADCTFNRPKDRGITSIGSGCQGLLVDQCQFLSNEQELAAQDRTTVAVNVNNNDAKLRNNRVVRFAHFAVIGGSGNIILGNHFFQGDGTTLGQRRAGIVLTTPNVKTNITSNYVDNCFIEWTNEHDVEPEFTGGFSFGGLTVNGNFFMVNDVTPDFCWFVVKPFGPGHFLNGFAFNDNVFRTVNTDIDRVEKVDTSIATLNFARFRNVVMTANPANGVGIVAQSPVMIEHLQNTASDTWTIDAAELMPFGARVRNVQSIVMEGPVNNASNVAQNVSPWVTVEQGPTGGEALLRWTQPVKGTAHVTVRCDNPI
jgi:Pectate lyase superfamily protein